MPHIHELYDFTVSFLILHPKEKKILLHYHQKLKCWNQLGGHIELDEQPIEALIREIKEEAGLNKDQYEIIETNQMLKPRGTVSLPLGFGLFVYNYADTGHKHIDIPYIIQSHTEVIIPAEGESTQINWFTMAEIREMNKNGLVEDGITDICEWIFNYIDTV
jgi:8-oxo-dGTP pyrophosphatase MutT (NUDIX family)